MLFWPCDSFPELSLTTYMPLKAELFLDRYITYESAFEPHSKPELPESDIESVQHTEVMKKIHI